MTGYNVKWSLCRTRPRCSLVAEEGINHFTDKLTRISKQYTKIISESASYFPYIINFVLISRSKRDRYLELYMKLFIKKQII